MIKIIIKGEIFMELKNKFGTIIVLLDKEKLIYKKFMFFIRI